MKKKHTNRAIEIAAILLILAGIIVLLLSAQQKRVSSPRSQNAEEYILRKLTQEDIAPGFTPALIYYCKTNGNFFCSVGTVFYGKNNGFQLLTSEHIFRTDVGYKGAYGVRILRPFNQDVTYMCESFVSTSSDMQNKDIAVIRLGNRPVAFSSFSDFTQKSDITLTFTGVTLAGNSVKYVRSVLSGEVATVIGIAVRKKGNDERSYLAISYENITGESGTCFVDEQKRKYVLHGGVVPGDEDWEKVLPYFRKHGREPIGLTFLAGPIGRVNQQ